jgi:hypothetical protein
MGSSQQRARRKPRPFVLIDWPRLLWMTNMSTITFDTHKFVKELESAGMPSAQAEAFVRAQQEILAKALDNTIAAKSDIAGPDSKFDRLIAGLDAKMDKLTWMMGILVALAIANFAKQFF